MRRSKGASAESLTFPLEVEDGWPPVASESLPCLRVGAGYQVQTAPLFVRDMSVGDVLDVVADADGNVEKWKHLDRSPRTTVWLLRLRHPNGIEEALAAFRALGCNTVALDSVGSYAVDVPVDVGMTGIDAILDGLEPDAVAVAFPSMRHPE